MAHCHSIIRLGSVLLATTVSPALLAASILVNTADDELNDDGDCSLREAVESANTNTLVDDCNVGSPGSTPDTITLLLTGNLTLDNGQLAVLEAVEILGPGSANLTIGAGPNSRHFHVDMPANAHDFSISFVTLSGGNPTGHGGAILTEQVGTLRLDSVVVSGNEATSTNQSLGGAVALALPIGNDSRLEIHDTVLESNAAGYRGGAVHIAGGSASSAVETIDIQRSLFRDNLANGSGGAIYAVGVPTVAIKDSVFDANQTDFDFSSGGEFGGAIYWNVAESINPFMRIDRSSFTDNVSRAAGGAISLEGGTTAIVNSTFERNRERTTGGEAFELGSQASLALFNSTLTNNGFGVNGDIAIEICDECSLTLTHSIVWSDWNPAIDCETNQFGVVNSNGYNIDGSGTCTGHATDLPSTDPDLLPLGDYGDDATGIVIPTRVPRPDSPAVDGGAASCTETFGAPVNNDQRGQPRPVTGPDGGSALCDIGAVEFQPNDNPTIFADRFEADP